ncbi:DUF4430 domain-containing protein [Paenibacillus rhizoplanae]
MILAAAQYELKKGESVLELLKRITRGQKIQMEYQGRATFAYVEGIDNLYEGDHGSESGWMYKVNGEFPSKAAGSWIVEPGDTIEWLYTLDLGKDLGGPKRHEQRLPFHASCSSPAVLCRAAAVRPAGFSIRYFWLQR